MNISQEGKLHIVMFNHLNLISYQIMADTTVSINRCSSTILVFRLSQYNWYNTLVLNPVKRNCKYLAVEVGTCTAYTIWRTGPSINLVSVTVYLHNSFTGNRKETMANS
jgi:hypothetical protein